MQVFYMKKPGNSFPFVSRILLCSHVFLLFFALCEGAIQLPGNLTIPALFAFGDSIVDQGNNNAIKTVMKCNFPPYGKDFAAGLPSGRFSNGRTPPDLMADELGIKKLIPAYLDPKLTAHDLSTGVSFASGGSGYDPKTSEIMSAIPMSDQLNQFKEYIGKLKGLVGEEGTTNILSQALFLLVAGTDDLANTYFTFRTRKIHYDLYSYANLIVDSSTKFVQELYKLGARKFAVFGIPPIGCLPLQRTVTGGLVRSCSVSYNQAAELVNSKLSPQLDALNQHLPQSRVVYIDVFSPLFDIIQHPQNYGFEVDDKGCCGTGVIETVILCNKYSSTCADDSKYVFWDSYHPTEKTYKILVRQLTQKYAISFV